MSRCDYACVNLSMLRSHKKSHYRHLLFKCSNCSALMIVGGFFVPLIHDTFRFLAVSHTRTVDPLHQLDFALSVSTTSFRGPVVRSNGQRAVMRKLLKVCGLRQISDLRRVKNDLRRQVFLTFHAESRRRGGRVFFSASPRLRVMASLRIYISCICTSDAVPTLRRMKLKTQFSQMR